MTGLAAPLLDWLARHTAAVVLVSAAIDATGLPFPGRLILLASGAIAAGGDVSVLLLIGLGALGAIASDHLWYFAGAVGSGRLLGLYCRLSFVSGRCRQRTVDWFGRYGPLTIVVGRFVAGVRLLAWPLARSHGVGYATFLVYDVAGALLWAAIWIGLGWVLGEQWRRAADQMTWAMPAALAAGVLAMLGTRLWRRTRYGAASL